MKHKKAIISSFSVIFLIGIITTIILIFVVNVSWKNSDDIFSGNMPIPTNTQKPTPTIAITYQLEPEFPTIVTPIGTPIISDKEVACYGYPLGYNSPHPGISSIVISCNYWDGMVNPVPVREGTVRFCASCGETIKHMYFWDPYKRTWVSDSVDNIELWELVYRHLGEGEALDIEWLSGE